MFALFTSLSNAEVKNLVIENAMIYNTLYNNFYAGILSNSAKNDVKVTNVTIKNSHIDLNKTGANYLGLLIGLIYKNSSVIIDGCTVESSSASASTGLGSTSSTSVFMMGGLVGYLETNVSLEIKNTNAKGTLSVSATSFDNAKYNIIYAGGLVGYVASGSQIKFNDNVISGRLTLVTINVNVYVAGLIGSCQTANENLTINSNEITFTYPESNANTKTNVYYNELKI